MNVVAKHIGVYSIVNTDGAIRPVKFSMKIDDQIKEIRVDNVLKTSEEKFNGNPMRVFLCQTKSKYRVKFFELRLEVNSQKWFLWKV